VATGQPRRVFRGHEGEVWCLAFAPDGTRLASGGGDMTALVWDLTAGRRPGRPLSADERDRLWTDLCGEDAAAAGRAVWDLVAAGDQAVSLLKDRVQPVRPAPAERVAVLVADLDSERFDVRERAAAELAKLGESAAAALRKALTAPPPSLELRRRLQRILARLDRWPPTPEGVRGLRAVEVLEHVGTPAARAALAALAAGAAEARLTREAKASLQRLTRQTPTP
jgi:hypothetical protein